jgi:single-stranded-DNA-specific exonuclease
MSVGPGSVLLAEARHVLDVSRSLSGRAWRARLDHDRDALAICQRHDLPDVLGRVLAARAVPLDTVEGYLNPTLRALMPDPDVLADMEAGVDRLARAIGRDERIAIIGDYDVDGMASSALLALYLEAAGAKPLVHIPDRITEGYGPSAGAISALKEKGAGLIVTLDCGSAAHEVMAHAGGIGLDAVIVDHHPAGEELPRACAVINPNRQDDMSGLGYLAAAGVTMMLMAGLNRRLRKQGFWGGKPEPDLLESLDLVALATVCDVVPLTGLNRAFVIQGLKVMAERRRPGLAALGDVARLTRKPDVHALGFVLGPRLNAAGRIGDAKVGLELLMTRDRARAQALAQQLETLNRERQKIELAVVDAAQDQAAAALQRAPDLPLLLVAGENWHPGILGLVAARLKERFGLPALALGLDPGGAVASGSGRSVAGVDLGRAVRAAADAGVIVKGGGHAMAAGLTVERARFDELQAFLAEALTQAGSGPVDWRLDLDGSLSASGATLDLLGLIERAGPYGSGNPEPVFALPAHRVVYADPVGGDHVRCTLAAGDGTRLKAVAFRAMGTPLGEALLGERAAPLHLAGRLCLDDWNGRRAVQMFIDDAAEVRGA